MVTLTKIIEAYTYTELSDTAKEAVKQWYCNDSSRNDSFYELIKEDLKNLFPNSKLDVAYSFGYCQGDGLNIHGELNLYDFIKIWDVTDKERRTMEFYLRYCPAAYTFSNDYRNCYSQKFIDLKYIDDVIDDFIYDLELWNLKNINRKLIGKFYKQMINFFTWLDEDFERLGYKYFDEPDDEEIEEYCAVNEYLFDEYGEVIYI